MKKTHTTLQKVKGIGWAFTAFLLLGPVHNVLAASGTGTGVTTLSNPLKWDNLNDLLNGLLDVALKLGAVAAVIMIIFSGFKLVMAQGNPEKIDDAKHMLFYTIIGTAILFGAPFLASIIQATVNSLKP